MKDKQTKDFYEFASFRLDIKKRRLMRGEEIIPLTPKEFDVLFFLIKNANRVVGKDELLETVWKDTFVEEGTLTRNISWLRKKLAVHVSDDVKIIETLPKRGYRFLPEIREDSIEIIVEEQTTQHVEIEEIIEFEEPSTDGNGIVSHQSTEIYRERRKSLPAAPSKYYSLRLWILPMLLIFALIGIAAYLTYFSQQPKVILASKIVPFSGSPGRENSPSFSPDGRQMVFSWDGGVEGRNPDIYIKLIGTGEPVRLTNDEAEEINPAFSPDGKSVAFLRVLPDHNEIILIPALGGAERKIYDKASYASVSFSPDGNFLASANLDLSGNETGIFTINLQTGEKNRLTMPGKPAVDHTPRFSPDGKNVAFIRYFNSFKREIFILPVRGGEPRQLTNDDVRIYSLAWNADSQSLLFTSFLRINQLNLWRISLSDKSEPQMIVTGSKNLQDLSISPDGRTVAFTVETADENIWNFEPNAPPKSLIRSTLADHSQQFSPDGTKIVFASDRSGNYEIWIADADGKNQRQLTDSRNSSAGSPRFSPDGRFILYDAQTAGNSGVYIVSVNGGESRHLTERDKNSSLPAWSNDGNSILFISNRSGSDQIWKMPFVGGEAVQLTRQGAFEMFAAPDGKNIIYSKGAGKTGLWTVSESGDDEKPIPELAEAGAWRSWTVTANGVYYLNPTIQPPYELMFMDFATRRTKEIMKFEKQPLSYYSNLSVSPDERRILYARQDQSASSIMLAELN